MRHAFTFIELLAVLAITSLLLALLVPVLGIAKARARATQCGCLLRKVDTAIGLFRADVGTYPFQAQPSGDLQANELAWRLGHAATTAERSALAADLAAAGAAYAAGGAHLFTTADVDPRETDAKGLIMHAGALNRLGTERARLAVLSGDVAVHGVAAHAGAPVLASPASRGWCDDYLGPDLTPSERDGDAIVDPWRHPLVLVCPVVTGVRGFWVATSVTTNDSHFARMPVREDWYGLGTAGRTATTTLASDLGTTAAAAYVAAPELWSAGPDGRIVRQRDDPADRDDLGAGPYRTGLQ